MAKSTQPTLHLGKYDGNSLSGALRTNLIEVELSISMSLSILCIPVIGVSLINGFVGSLTPGFAVRFMMK